MPDRSRAPSRPEGQAAHDQWPLSQGQRALWFLHRLAPTSPAYNVAYVGRVHSALDIPAAREALHHVLARHAVLRATFPCRDGEPFQCISPSDAVDFVVAALPHDERARTEHIEEIKDRPFDVERGPLLRFHVLREAAGTHLLVLVAHHLIFDLWSLDLLLKEFRIFYLQETSGVSATLPPPTSYREHILREQELLAGPESNRLWKYWQTQLNGTLPTLDLPTDRPRPRTPSHRAETHEFSVDSDLTERLRHLAGAQKVTPFAVATAAFFAFLHRYSRQEDLIVGTATVGRELPTFARAAGYFTNTIALRGRCPDEATFLELLHNVKRTIAGGMEHQQLPFSLVVERLQPNREANRSPIFQTMIVWHRGLRAMPRSSSATPEGACTSPQDNAELVMEHLTAEQRGADHDLTLTVSDRLRSLSAAFRYSADLFDASTVERMARHFHTLLQGAVARPETRLCELPLLSDAEHVQFISSASGAETPLPHCTLPHLFEEQVQRTPDDTAVVHGDERMSFRTLNRGANRLARELRARGVRPEVPVAVCLERSPLMVLALLAVLKAGGGYVPLDPAYPPDRLALCLEDSGADIVLTQESLCDTVPGNAHLISVDTAPTVDADDDENLPLLAGPEHMAYLLYTSGSTGRPRGVVVEHRNIVSLLAWAHRHYPPQERQAILASTSICFDLSVFELFVPLAWGGAVILASDLNRLPTLPARDEVTLVNTVPSVLERLLQHSSLPPSVTTVNLAGERLSAVVARAVYGSGRVEKLYNLYGPTEFTTYSTCALVPRDTAGEPTIGRPIDNTRAYVLDTRLKPVPTGVIGELHLGGAGLARGYVARPELTARKFIADPFSTPSSSSQRLYRTGDLVRRLGNGELQFVGRVDRQLKVRGFRIEPEEIEVALRRHTRVRESFVMGRSSDDGLELIAYVVPRGALTVTELRRSLAATLPGHMLPTTFVFLEELPRHPNGKVDSQRLPAPEARRPELQAGFVEPRGALEKRMAQIWADVLGVERVGIHDNFFELGGTSLQSLEVASRANDAGMPLLPEHLFAFQTIAELSAAAPVKSIEARVEQLARHDVKRAS